MPHWIELEDRLPDAMLNTFHLWIISPRVVLIDSCQGCRAGNVECAKVTRLNMTQGFDPRPLLSLLPISSCVLSRISSLSMASFSLEYKTPSMSGQSLRDEYHQNNPTMQLTFPHEWAKAGWWDWPHLPPSRSTDRKQLTHTVHWCKAWPLSTTYCHPPLRPPNLPTTWDGVHTPESQQVSVTWMTLLLLTCLNTVYECKKMISKYCICKPYSCLKLQVQLVPGCTNPVALPRLSASTWSLTSVVNCPEPKGSPALCWSP
jgi:hypothetical protein